RGSHYRRGARTAVRVLIRRRRYHARYRLRFEVTDDHPDAFGPEHPAVRRHAFRPSVEDRMKDVFIRAAVAPAPVHEARPNPTGRVTAVASVAVHGREQPGARGRVLRFG